MEDVLILKDYKTVPDIVHEYGPTLKFGHIPLVIDNGNMYTIYVKISLIKSTLRY